MREEVRERDETRNIEESDDREAVASKKVRTKNTASD